MFSLGLFSTKDSNFVNEFMNRGDNLSIAFEIVSKSSSEINVFEKLSQTNATAEKKLNILVESSNSFNEALSP